MRRFGRYWYVVVIVGVDSDVARTRGFAGLVAGGGFPLGRPGRRRYGGLRGQVARLWGSSRRTARTPLFHVTVQTLLSVPGNYSIFKQTHYKDDKKILLFKFSFWKKS